MRKPVETGPRPSSAATLRGQRETRGAWRGYGPHLAFVGLLGLALAAAYAPRSMDRKDPRLSPLYADLKGLPPCLIQVGSAETLLDDAVRFAAAAGEADVSVTLEIWPHMIHAWPLWNARLEPGRRALAHLGAFLRQNL